MAEFMFVNLSDPTQNKRRGVRKLVRSHVSCVQHSQKRIELGDVRKQSQSRYTDRSVNAWELLDDSKAGQLSQLSANAASDVDSSLLTQHHTTLPGLGPIRCLRQVSNKELTAAGNSRRRPRRNQCLPKASPAPPTPILDGEGRGKKGSLQAVSRLFPAVKSETGVMSPDRILIRQEPEYETDYKWDTVSQHSLRWGWEDDEPSFSSFPPFYSSLDDPTDEVRIWVELSRISLPSVLVSSP
jgi:hypothetical protein